MIGVSQTNFKRLNLNLSVIFIASVIIVLPIFFIGIPNGNDMPQHYQSALTFYDSIQNGNFYPSFADKTNDGFGDVGVRFYPPFAYYVLAGFRCLAGNWFDASVLTFAFWFFLSGVGVYFWCREWFGENASLTAAVIYIFMPYHANQIYNAFMYAEFAASAILPFCFLFVTRICREGKITSVIGLAVFYSLLILTNLPMAIIGSISLLIYSIFSLKKDHLFPTLLRLSSAVFLGMLASSFYWMRMVSELNFVRVASSELTSGEYSFQRNFIFSFLSFSTAVDDSRQLWLCDLMLLVTLGMVVPGAIVFYKWASKNNTQKLLNLATMLVFAVFITTPLSFGIWENFALLQKIQFPWRWLAIVSLSGTVFVAATFNCLTAFFSDNRRPVALLTFGLIIAGIIFTCTQIIKPSIQIPRQDFVRQTENLLKAESYEWSWTIWLRREAFNSTEKAVAENRPAQIIAWQPTNREILFSAGNSTNAKLSALYYPHWKATINNQPADLSLADDGTMLVSLPPEEANVKIWFQEPSPVKAAYYISILSWLVFAFILVFNQAWSPLRHQQKEVI